MTPQQTIQSFLDQIKDKGTPKEQVCSCKQKHVAYSNWNAEFARSALPKAGKALHLAMCRLENIQRIGTTRQGNTSGGEQAYLALEEIARILSLEGK